MNRLGKIWSWIKTQIVWYWFHERIKPSTIEMTNPENGIVKMSGVIQPGSIQTLSSGNQISINNQPPCKRDGVFMGNKIHVLQETPFGLLLSDMFVGPERQFFKSREVPSDAFMIDGWKVILSTLKPGSSISITVKNTNPFPVEIKIYVEGWYLPPKKDERQA